MLRFVAPRRSTPRLFEMVHEFFNARHSLSQCFYFGEVFRKLVECFLADDPHQGSNIHLVASYLFNVFHYVIMEVPDVIVLWHVLQSV